MLENFPKEKYKIIYIDPPWNMGAESNKRVLLPKYETMSDEEIIDLPLSSIADNNSALLLWSISSKIPQSIRLIEKNGFRYIGIAFCWVKTSKKTGLPNCRMSGNYTLQGVEICLLGIKGSVKVINKNVRQVLMHPRLFHSKKPDIIREEIVNLFGDLKKVELFARQKTKNWDAWGNEI